MNIFNLLVKECSAYCFKGTRYYLVIGRPVSQIGADPSDAQFITQYTPGSPLYQILIPESRLSDIERAVLESPALLEHALGVHYGDTEQAGKTRTEVLGLSCAALHLGHRQEQVSA